MTTLSEKLADPSWVLDPIVAIGGVRNAVILSADGMVVGACDRIERDPKDSRAAMEGIAAMVSSLQGAARAAAAVALDTRRDTPISTFTVELAAVKDPDAEDSEEPISPGRFTVMPAGKYTNTFIAVAYGPETPMGIVAHTMTKQANKLGEALMSVSARTDDSAS
jgi:hypothetical protein